MPLSDNIKVLRQKALLTQEAFANELGISPSTVIRWESGAVCPNITAMKSIKGFCETNHLSYIEIESSWIEAKRGGTK